MPLLLPSSLWPLRYSLHTGWDGRDIPPQTVVNPRDAGGPSLENLSGDAGQDYFSDGLTEEMIAHLGQLQPAKLGVIARTSVAATKRNQRLRRKSARN